MEIEEILISLIGIFAIFLVILAFADLYAGEWESVAQNLSPLLIAIIAFAVCIAGVAYWRQS